MAGSSPHGKEAATDGMAAVGHGPVSSLSWVVSVCDSQDRVLGFYGPVLIASTVSNGRARISKIESASRWSLQLGLSVIRFSLVPTTRTNINKHHSVVRVSFSFYKSRVQHAIASL